MLDTTKLDQKSYEMLLRFINEQYFKESKGHEVDLAFLSDDWWLGDTAVVNNIARKRGMWEISLVFAHHEFPLKLISRIISSHASKTKAETFAFYMTRQAAKDQRGTLAVELSHFNFCYS